MGRPLALQVPGDMEAKLDRPAADGLVADIDPVCGQRLLDVAKAEGEADDVRIKTMTLG